jgi:hypothetical protein
MLEREGCVVPEKVDSADIVISSEIRVEDARGRGALKFMSGKRWLRSFFDCRGEWGGAQQASAASFCAQLTLMPAVLMTLAHF